MKESQSNSEMFLLYYSIKIRAANQTVAKEFYHSLWLKKSGLHSSKYTHPHIKNLPKTNVYFRYNLSTADLIFPVFLFQIQEKSVEQDLDLYTVFINLMKVFDTINM